MENQEWIQRIVKNCRQPHLAIWNTEHVIGGPDIGSEGIAYMQTNQTEARFLYAPYCKKSLSHMINEEILVWTFNWRDQENCRASAYCLREDIELIHPIRPEEIESKW